MGQPTVRYESGQSSFAFEEMTDSGDNTLFSASTSPLSRASGFAPTVAPWGLKTGGAITPGGSNDTVDVAACTVVAPGMTGADADGIVTVSAAAAQSITRAVSTDTHMINSITVDNTGTIAVITGIDGTSFSETRGAAGGPPLIPVDSIEIGQVRTTSDVAAVVLASEILTVPGIHTELSDFPTYAINYATGEVTFASALPDIHTGSLPKKVEINGATPIFADVPKASDWVPAEATYSVNSTDTYDGPIGSSSSALAQASFSALLADGLSDNFVRLKGENLWFEFRPDRDLSLPKQLTQGLLGIARTFPAGGGSISASCTVTPEQESTDILV